MPAKPTMVRVKETAAMRKRILRIRPSCRPWMLCQGDNRIYFYAGPVYRPHDDEVMKVLRRQRLRQNVILMLTTFGGDASAGYRISRAFQRRYKTGAYKPESKSDEARGRFTVFVDSICGSAGTIVVLGADELIMSEFGELGPIDVQLRKPDDVMARSSGLTPTQALEILERQSQKLFSRILDN